MEHDDAIDHLLREADSAVGVPRPRESLADEVRRLRSRRTSQKIAATSLAACAVIGFAIWQQAGLPAQDKTIVVRSNALPAIDRDNLRQEASRIERNAGLRLAAIDEFLKHQAAQERAASEFSDDPVTELRWQREQAALILVRQGDRLATEMNLPIQAAVAYQRASDVFPDTHWASVAQSRLLDNGNN